MYAYILLGMGLIFIYNAGKALYKSITLSVEKLYKLSGTIVDFESKATKNGTTHFPIIKYKDPIDHKKKKFKSNIGRPTQNGLKRKLSFTYIRNFENEIICEEQLIISRIIAPSLFMAIGIVLIIIGVIKLDIF